MQQKTHESDNVPSNLHLRNLVPMFRWFQNRTKKDRFSRFSSIDSQHEDKTIVLTGGHAGTTALAILQEITKRHASWNIHWIGPEKAHEGKKVLTIEAKTFPRLNVVFHPIRAGKLQRKWSRHTVPTLLRFPLGFYYAYRILTGIKPDLILSFGGYAAFPVVVVGWIMQIPVLIQEQITGLGFANRISLPFARKILLARKEGLIPSKGKGVVLGNPVNPAIAALKPKKDKHTPPALFIFAGSRGSKQINDLLKPLLSQLLEKYVLYHHTGDLDFEEFNGLKRTIDHSENYYPMKFIDPQDVPGYYEKSDILIGRAGANTVTELMVVGLPAILIPLTWTNYQEQVLNARNAEQLGFARVFLPDQITSDMLLKTIHSLDKMWKSTIAQFDTRLADLDRSAAEKIVDMLEVSSE